MFPQNVHATVRLCSEQAIQNPLFMGFNVHQVGGGFARKTDVQENQICWHRNKTLLGCKRNEPVLAAGVFQGCS